MSLGVAQTLWIVNERAGLIGLYKTITGVVVCLGGNLFLIPVYGAKGAAVVAVAVQFVSAVASNAVLAPSVLTAAQGARPSPAAAGVRSSVPNGHGRRGG